MATTNNGKRTNTSSRNNKKSNTSNKNTRNSNQTKKMSEDDLLVINYIVILGSVFACIFLFLCTYSLVDSSIGVFVKEVMFGLFGQMAYVLPFFLIICTFLWISKQSDKRLAFKLSAVIVLFVCIGIIFELTDGYSAEEGVEYSISKIYDCGRNEQAGGGVIAGSIAFLLNSLIEKIATFILVLFISFICFIVIFGKSFLDVFSNGGAKIRDTAREAGEYRREKMSRGRESVPEYEERPRKRINNFDLLNPEVQEEKVNKKNQRKEDKETESILRMDKKFSGIADTTIQENPVKKQDDMHEIILKEEVSSSKEKIKVSDSNIMDRDIRFHTADYDDGYSDKLEEEKKCENDNLSSFNEPQPFEEVPQAPVRRERKAASNIAKNNSEEKILSSSKTEKKADYSNEKYKFPPLSLLSANTSKGAGDSRTALAETAKKLEGALESFGVSAKVTDISQGPSVTRYELEPAIGVKVSRITSLADDLKLHLAAKDIRIEAPIPGKSAVGIEVPNSESSGVKLRELFEDSEFKNFGGNIMFAVGKDISGKVIVTDISKMPHMLIAGSTGSGKSVCINTLIMSIIYKHDPKDVQLIMVDPKVVELNIYNGIPHLMIPVVTDPKKAAGALNWAVAEMTDRYKKFADMNVRDLKGYNKKVAELNDDDPEHRHLPQIVIIVDELADLMMVAAKEVEESICRLAQLARACGIHLILATQRPSVDVITGLIKANMPSRVAFAVSSGVDSRTILDMNGAEKLLGKGDMLFYPQGYTKPARIQGAFVSDNEVADVVEFIKNQKLHNEFSERAKESVEKVGSSNSTSGNSDGGSEYDELFVQAGYFIIEANKASIGNLQRKFKIGFNRAARIMDQLCEAGVVGSDQGTKPREIIMSQEQFDQFVEEYV